VLLYFSIDQKIDIVDEYDGIIDHYPGQRYDTYTREYNGVRHSRKEIS